MQRRRRIVYCLPERASMAGAEANAPAIGARRDRHDVLFRASIHYPTSDILNTLHGPCLPLAPR